MIRQLRRLTRSVGGRGTGDESPPRPPSPDPRPPSGEILALATYAEARNAGFELRRAAEQGFEGVACLDDAARAAILYCAIWRDRGLGWAREAAEGFLRFVGFVQEEDGRFVNFVLDWQGRKNLTGPTSAPGGWAWTARAMHALACGIATFRDVEYDERFRRGLPWMDRPCPYLDVRAVCVLAALEWWAATGAAEAAERALAWAEEIAAGRLGDVLPDVSGRSEIHLWGHLQEAALARVGLAFDRADLIRAARDSAEAVFVPPVERAFDARTTLPFDVSCAVLGLDAVAAASGEARYTELAELARDWFRGRNAAGRPVYDRARGLVHDGIDDGRLNANSGAESNLEGALALLDSLPWDAYE